MRFGPRAVLAGGLGFAVSLLAACGGGAGLLSGSQSNAMNSQLDSISQALADGQCGSDLRSAVNQFDDYVSSLPASVNAALRANLTQGASTVSQLAAQDCSSSTSTTTTTPTTTTSSTPTSTSTGTSTSSTTTETTTSTSTSSSTTTSSSSTDTTTTDTTTSDSGGAGIGGENSGASGSSGSSGNTGNGTGGAGTGGGNS